MKNTCNCRIAYIKVTISLVICYHGLLSFLHCRLVKCVLGITHISSDILTFVNVVRAKMTGSSNKHHCWHVCGTNWHYLWATRCLICWQCLFGEGLHNFKRALFVHYKRGSPFAARNDFHVFMLLYKTFLCTHHMELSHFIFICL